jgi:hypothetical protein
MRAYNYSPAQCAEYLLDDPSADLLTLHDLRRRARDGRLRIVPVSQTAPVDREVHTVSETPVEGLGAAARWIALLDRAEQLQQEGLDSEPVHPTLQRQIARAIDSLFLYEHQMLPAARRQAREYLWQRDRTEALPPPQNRAEWERCRCRTCLLARLMQRPAVAQQLERSTAEDAQPNPAPTPAAAPAVVPVALRSAKSANVSHMPHAPRPSRPAQRRLLPSEAQAS